MKLFIFILSLSLFSFAQAATFKVNPSKSKVVWLGKKVTGEHTGNVAVSDGTFNVEGTMLKSGTVNMDMSSITCTDLTDPEYNKKLVDHLKSEDFFSTAKFKTATLKIKDVMMAKGGKYTVNGDLTIKGKTLPVTFDADLAVTDKMVKGSGTMLFDRTAYDIKYNSGKFFPTLGDKTIYDEVSVKIDFEAAP